MLKSFRFVLFPLSILYGFIIWLRNILYDKNILSSESFNFPIVCVGNLAIGGTGKTPMVEYLVRLLKEDYKVATMSRGYKRKTKGFAIANEGTTALDIGDEPMQFYKKFPDITVSVAEERLVSIPQLLHDKPGTQVIILDDAFQHRQVRAGLNILLTEYKDLFTRDFILPAGNLRDIKASYKRADIIIVTKCKSHITEDEKNKIIEEIKPLSHQKIFFTKIEYGSPYHLFNKQEKFLSPDTNILLVCGIANPKPIKEILNTYASTYDMMRFRDHHIFSIDDLKDIKEQFEKLETENKIILTTEKDGVRLVKFENELKDLPVYVFPIRHKVLFGQDEQLNIIITDFVKSFSL
ncbi:MAG: tetraacyldisaccharide 4'-kinase [Chitinophagaceae bacterium]|nr:tetraacyldisaccharide 4'-kinase [Chitinophagaceae bacterium]